MSVVGHRPPLGGAGRWATSDGEDRVMSRDSDSGARRLQYRFGTGAGGTERRLWHAVDLQLYGEQIAATRDRGARRGLADVFSVCGTRSHYVPLAGQFTYDSPFLRHQRCERCGWVVALDRGTVDQEIDLYVSAAGGADRGLLRQIFTAILADLPPGREAQAGHRSELLAHAARHRPTVAACEQCSAGAAVAEVHGRGVAVCPDSLLVCGSCTFTAGQWAGKAQGMTTGECVVSAPCSVLVSLAQHYELSLDGSWRSSR